MSTMRVSQLGVGTEQLNAVFFTHMHNDHTEALRISCRADGLFHGTGPKIDAVCSSDVVSPQGFTVSCRKFVTHLADAYIQSGEISQCHSEVQDRTAGGPSEIDQYDYPSSEGRAPIGLVVQRCEGQRNPSTQIRAMMSYRVDTPAGSVVNRGTPE